MRSIFVSLIVGLALPSSAMADNTALLAKYSAPCSVLPPANARFEPMDPYVIATIPSAKLQRVCGRGAHPAIGCAYESPKHNGSWIIVVDSALDRADFSCVLLYEKAHLPPNNWVDQAWESYLNGR